jgi:hypothetical protein
MPVAQEPFPCTVLANAVPRFGGPRGQTECAGLSQSMVSPLLREKTASSLNAYAVEERPISNSIGVRVTRRAGPTGNVGRQR